jgi:hypothetical protein
LAEAQKRGSFTPDGGEQSSWVIAKDFACIAKVAARKKVSKIWRFSAVW